MRIFKITMAEMNLFFVLTCVGLMFLASEAGRLSIQRRSVDNEETDWTKLTCTCNDETKVVTADRYVSAIFLESPNCSMNVDTALCDMMKICEDCSLENQLCFGSPTGRGKECIKSHVELYNEPASTEIPGISELFSNKTARSRRSLLDCSHPWNLRTADVLCMSHRTFMTCKEECIVGYTLREGISKELSCKKGENQWKPSGFEECEPFIDCYVSLRSTGLAECVTATRKVGHNCNVTCDQYEDRKPVPMQNYECKASGAWSRPLPFCVSVGSGLALVPAPSIIDHKENNSKHGFA